MNITTEIYIWSVGKNFELLTFNEPFARHMEKRYGIKLAVGKTVLGDCSGSELADLRAKWTAQYKRVLKGESILLEEDHSGETLRYSLSPITEEEDIVGVMVLAQKADESVLPQDASMGEASEKTAELRLMTLRSILNSHFIFNALSSIQFFIARSEKINAIRFLSIFSRFIRSILTHAIATSISVSDEMAMLQNYVEMEMTRFEDTFDFVLEIDPETDMEAVRIPPLLIQPFVENAILHGLYNMSQKGKLLINVYEADHSIVFQIEDNGVGRKKGLTLKRRNSPDREPLGLKLATERLRLIPGPTPARLEITDLEDNGVPCGTRVIITVPRQTLP